MTRFKTIVRYSSYLLGSRILSRLLFTIFFIYAASRLGPELFGALSFALVLAELLSSIGDLGISRYAARELVRHWERKEILAGEVLSIQGITSIVLSLGGVLVIAVYNPAYPKLQMLLLAMVVVLLSAIINTAESIFVATQNFFYSALFTFVGRLLYVIMGFVAIYIGASAVVVMLAFLFGVTIEAFLKLIIVLRRITSFSFAFSISQLGLMLSAVKPFALTAAANIIYLRANIIVLEMLEGDVAVGVFNIAFTLFIPFVWLPMILQRTVFPGLTKIYADDPDMARIHSWQWFRLMAIVGIPIAVTVSFLAGTVLSYFPEGYEESIPVLIILMSSIPLALYSSVGFNILQVVDREKSYAGAATAAAVASVVFNFVFIALFGVIGAALAFLAAAIVLSVYIYILVHKFFLRRSVLRLYIKPVFAGAAMLAVTLILWQAGQWFATGAGLAAYVAAIFSLKALRPAELKNLFRD